MKYIITLKDEIPKSIKADFCVITPPDGYTFFTCGKVNEYVEAYAVEVFHERGTDSKIYDSLEDVPKNNETV